MKGFFTQTVVVLFKQSPTLDELEPLLAAYRIGGRKDEFEHWEFGGPSFTVAFRLEVNGLCNVDIVNRRWPDHMGDPKTEMTLFGAWSMGHFGPLTFPQGLERAIQHCYNWPEGRTIAAQHESFVRIRLSYIFGAPKDAPVMPKDCNPAAELDFVMGIAKALLKHPAALCLFNPNGEVLCQSSFIDQVETHYRAKKLPPVDLFTNVRMFKVDEEWMLMDTVGMGQLDVHDVEVVFSRSAFKPSDIEGFLRNTSLYIAEHGEVIQDGHTIDGPGGALFRAKRFEEAFTAPPRHALRFRADKGRAPPAQFGFETKKRWQFWK
jgi:hypothetical protein